MRQVTFPRFTPLVWPRSSAYTYRNLLTESAAAEKSVILSRENFLQSASRFLMPSARDIIFIFLFLSLLAGTLSNRPLADPDIGWHIRTGERIISMHMLPRTDPYSSTMQGQPWIAWEWLYDAALGFLHREAGLNGVVWLCAVLVASTFMLLLSQLVKRGTGLLFSVALMLMAEAAATIHLFARPHIASWLLALLWFIALDRWDSGGAAPWLPWFFPLSMLLWVNLHGEWILGLALFSIYVLASAIKAMREKDLFDAIRAGQRARKQFRFWLLSAVATLANPFGWNLHRHVYRYLGDRYLMNRIAEFRSPDFHGWAQRSFAMILLLTLVALAGQRVRLNHFLVLLLAVYAGLFSSRNLPVSSMLLVLIVGPLLWRRFVSLGERPGVWPWLRARILPVVALSDRMGVQELQLRGHVWPAACVVGALVICLQGGWVGSHQMVHAGFDPKSVPVAAADFLDRRPDTEPVFSLDSWSGYLIYRLYPRRQVVVDDRHDLYGSDRIRQILILMQGEPGWREVLVDWHIRLALLPADSTLANLLRQMPEQWRITYQDKISVVFERPYN
jgi:hypothetical protein